MSKKLSIELSDEIAELLENLSIKVNQSSAELAHDVILEFVSEQMDADIALKRLNNSNEKEMSSEELKKELGL